MLKIKSWSVLAILSLLIGCQTASPPPAQTPETGLSLVRAQWSDLPGWPDPDIANALDPFRRSCRVLANRDRFSSLGPDGIGGLVADWLPICAAIPADGANSQAFFEKYFLPAAVTFSSGKDDGLFTGYYEPLLHGARQRTKTYSVPLFRRPDNLISVDLGQFRPALKGERIAGRLEGNRLIPFANRAGIVDGALDADKDALIWVNDPIDAFFLEIQGSGQVQLPDGSLIRVGYDGQNGHPYIPIGRELRAMGALEAENVSMQSIREWLVKNPDQRQKILNHNPSVVFFREITGEGPLGGQGVALTPGRSLAIDRSLLPYGAPIWLDAADPVVSNQRLQRLMIAQDTGGAIRGAVRGDVFWGSGDDAAHRAGIMKSPGKMWILLPRHQQLVQKPSK